MNTNISQLSFAPIATVVSAMIAAAVSIVNLTLNKEQKTSEFRQAWIDGLRSELATFFSTGRALGRSFEERRNPNIRPEDLDVFGFSPEKVGEMRLLAADSLYKIKLRLNPNEPDHMELVRLLDQIINKQNRINTENGTDYYEAFEAIERATEHSQSILKKEWDRVKKGETPFRLIRNWVSPAIFMACIGFLFLYH